MRAARSFCRIGTRIMRTDFCGKFPTVVWEREAPPIYYVAEVDGDLAGFAGMIPTWLREGVWDFTWINVRKEYRSEGIGSALMRHRIAEVRRCAGEIVHLMTMTPDWFGRFGFQAVASYGDWQLMAMRMGDE